VTEPTTRAFYANVDDPQSPAPVIGAYCVLVEVHLNYELQATIAVFQCWRSKSAYTAGCGAFTVIQASFPPDEGGKPFFAQHLPQLTALGQALRNYAAAQDPQIQSALQGEKHPDGTDHASG